MLTMTRIHRTGVAVSPDRTITDVARVMNSSGVGSIAVIDDGRLVGIVTDRDLVRRGIARGLPPDARVDAVMSMPVLTVEHDVDVHEAIDEFGRNGVRRLAVTRDGEFVGIISLDDLLLDLAHDLTALTAPLSASIDHPRRDSPLPAST